MFLHLQTLKSKKGIAAKERFDTVVCGSVRNHSVDPSLADDWELPVRSVVMIHLTV